MTIDLPDFSNARVLVVGDVMLDRYWHGTTGRISPEAPVPVVLVKDGEERPGGAGNVALNMAVLGGKPVLLGVTGDDDSAHVLEDILGAAGVTCHFEREPGVPTVTKLRVLSRHQQLIRLDFEAGFPGFDPARLLNALAARLDTADVVVLSDYGKGALANAPELIARARAAGKTVLVDPKNPDFSHYRGASVVTPNLAEFETVVGRCRSEEDIARCGAQLMEKHQFDALLVTRGEHGMTLLESGKEPRHLPTRAREVYDVTGAGDTVISVLAAGMAAGLPLETATHLANLAAGIVVAKVGTASVTVHELRRALQEEQARFRGVLDEEALAQAIEDARAHGETIVFTNGCFDILHAGHVTYLEQASRLGDRLVVAVNHDDTVRQLKGPDRPVNSLDRRMKVLAALACVDWVVPFAEETPERMICRLKPDLLVKGGDNDPDSIPGADCVRQAGGEVRVMEYVPEVSTTGLISSIRANDE